MKKLVTEQTVKEFYVGHGKDYPFPIDDNTLITPLAKDKAKSLGITFEKQGACSKKTECVESKPAVATGVSEAAEAISAQGEYKAKDYGCSMTYERQAIVEAVLKALEARGILDKILE